MKVEFINHASVIISSNETKIFCDPWIDGSIFNEGWDHIIKTKFNKDRFKEISYIWFSHEHPDHFSTSTLKSVDENIRSSITVLYQTTKDKKVLNFCKSLGYQIFELPNMKRVKLNKDFEIICGKSGFYDSWLFLKDDKHSLMNLNDCHVDSKSDAININKKINNQKINVLLSQFSYAAWRGNKEDSLLRKDEAENKLNILKNQIDILQPDSFIPFASYIYFSHVENKYLNDQINKSYELVNLYENTKTILMYPGDIWEMNNDFSSNENIYKYKEAYKMINDLNYKVSSTIEYEQLKNIATEYTKRIRNNNNRLILNLLSNMPFLGIMNDIYFYVNDIKHYVVYSKQGQLKKIELNEIKREDIDDIIILSSNSLNFLFKFDWGLDTLLVNGRFQTTPNGLLKLIKSFGVMTLNNIGKRLEFKLILDYELLYFSFKSIYSAIGKYKNKMAD